ncbi:c-type cytochrome domain-containing protein [uncultured Pseudomonas sp.]|uniref:c-type cytochrome domain-containing protein n=1 Tax=uncultured Pseudomonas sp. TaxID=114707 RepID=UPI00261B745D|nr:c-type cytochrome domain-containing protein [uncultured Pseudomonas sp.]
MPAAVLPRWPLYWLVLLVANQSQGQTPVTYGDLAPILHSRCVLCHAGPQPPLDLALDSLEHLLSGSRRGPIVKPGDAEGSELIQRLKGSSLPRMPMTGPPYLGDEQIELFERWINDGLQPGPTISPATTPARPAAGEPVNYSHVEPLFTLRCAKCHSASGLLGSAPEGYILASYAEVIRSDERARVVPGAPEASELVRRIRGQARPRMPHDGPPFFDDEDIALIVAWVQQGARDAQGIPAVLPAGSKVRLHGTLEPNWTLDGLPLQLSPATRIDNAPQPGDYVQVRGRTQRDGTLSVERIRPR